MTTISSQEAATHFPGYLAEVEAGHSFVIARGSKVVAMLVPVQQAPARQRPKVGETLDPPFPLPDDAFAPLSGEELKSWGL